MKKIDFCSRSFWGKVFWALVFINLMLSIISGLRNAPPIGYHQIVSPNTESAPLVKGRSGDGAPRPQ